MFIALTYRVIPLRQERNVKSTPKHIALRWSAGYLGMRGYKHGAPLEHFIRAVKTTCSLTSASQIGFWKLRHNRQDCYATRYATQSDRQ